MCASFIDVFLGQHESTSAVSTPPEALMHITQAFRLTNQKLSGDGALTNYTMASVVSLSLHEQLSRDYTRGRVHLDGLVKMVRLRGGLVRLPKELAQKICRYEIELD